MATYGGAAAATGTSKVASSTVIFDSMGFRSTSEPTTHTSPSNSTSL